MQISLITVYKTTVLFFEVKIRSKAVEADSRIRSNESDRKN